MAQAAVARVDAAIVGDVVAVVAVGRRHERRQPDDVDPEGVEVLDAAREAGEVARAVAGGVGEGLEDERVDDGVLVPEVVDHGGGGFYGSAPGAANNSRPEALMQ